MVFLALDTKVVDLIYTNGTRSSNSGDKRLVVALKIYTFWYIPVNQVDDLSDREVYEKLLEAVVT